jgi:hypothetical protein
VAENQTPIQTVRFDVSLEQAAVIDEALRHYRKSYAFALTASAATDDERTEARRKLYIIDRIRGMRL